MIDMEESRVGEDDRATLKRCPDCGFEMTISDWEHCPVCGTVSGRFLDP